MSNLISIESLSKPMLHIDADAFFTSVEQSLNPDLKGKPVITGKERGIVACASYEAKALGIRRPMKLYEARQSCPQLICLPSDYEAYSLFSKRMFEILRRFTPMVEEYSIDEAFAELSGLRRVHRTSYSEIALKIKHEVERELGLNVTVGLSLSKTLAKLASKSAKPNGFKVVKGRELHTFLKEMPLADVCGLGPNSVSLLKKHGVQTPLDYVGRSEKWVRSLLGKIGVELWLELRGQPMYKIETQEKHDYASISKVKTFTPASNDRDFVYAQLLRNLESAMIKLRRHQLRAKRLSVFLRTQDFKSWGLEADFDRSTSSILDAAPLAEHLFAKVFKPEFRYRLTGVYLSRLEGEKSMQYSLFDDVPRIRALRALDRVVDGVNELYGKHTLHLGTTLWLGRHRQHLSERGDLPQRKTTLLKGENFRQRLNIPMLNIKV